MPVSWKSTADSFPQGRSGIPGAPPPSRSVSGKITPPGKVRLSSPTSTA
ncbi:MAG: hypothetical protein P8074_15055 [Anaerolineales bacterium]